MNQQQLEQLERAYEEYADAIIVDKYVDENFLFGHYYDSTQNDDGADSRNPYPHD